MIGSGICGSSGGPAASGYRMQPSSVNLSPEVLRTEMQMRGRYVLDLTRVGGQYTCIPMAHGWVNNIYGEGTKSKMVELRRFANCSAGDWPSQLGRIINMRQGIECNSLRCGATNRLEGPPTNLSKTCSERPGD